MENNEKLILCVGVCVLDLIFVVENYPKEDADIRSKRGRWQRGGNASNNCTVLNLLGEKCEFLGTFSNEPMFKFVIDDMIQRGIKVDHCIYHSNCQSPLSSVLLSETSHSRTIVHSNPDLKDLTFNDFQKLDLSKYKWIHFEGRVARETKYMMEMVVKFNENKSDIITISVDLEKRKEDNMFLAEMADFVFLGKDFSTFMNWNDMKTAVYSLRNKIRKQNTIFCTWGDAGTCFLDSDNKYFTCPAYSCDKILDTLGAGDTFCSSVIFFLTKNKCLEEAVKFGNKIAGIKIGFFGYDDIKNIKL